MDQLPDWIDYIWLSPIFQSISKPGYQKKWDIPQLKESIKSSPVPVFALGGLREENIAIAAEMGFHGIALKGTLWESTDPVQKLEKILRNLNQ
jgi:thiamine-phosphate pyrophosphorylase